MNKLLKITMAAALATSTMMSSASAFCVVNNYGKDIHVVFAFVGLAVGESLTKMTGRDRMLRYLRAQKGAVIFKDLGTLGVQVGVAAGKAAIAAETGMGAQDAAKSAGTTVLGAANTISTTAKNVESVINLKALPKAGDAIFMSHGGPQSLVTAASRGTNKIKWNKTIKPSDKQACWNTKDVAKELNNGQEGKLLFFITERQTTDPSPVLFVGAIDTGGWIDVTPTFTRAYMKSGATLPDQYYK